MVSDVTGSDVAAMTRAEGEAVVAYRREMPTEGWERSTVCDPWTIGHLVAHLTTASSQTFRNVAKGLAFSGFNRNEFADRDLQKYLGGSPDGRIDRLEEAVQNPSTPKPLKEIVLVEMICHGDDIRRPTRLITSTVKASRPCVPGARPSRGPNHLRQNES